jgi:hypothetical protein
MTEKQRAGWLDEMRGLGDLGKSGGLIYYIRITAW